jgi:transposase InsO family protein
MFWSVQLGKIWGNTRAPDRLHSDNGLEFTGKVLRLCRDWGVKQVHGRPYRPQTQGGVERLGQTAKTKLRAAFIDTPDIEWPAELLRIQKQINNCPTRVLGGLSPHEALFGDPDPKPVQPKSGNYAELLGDGGDPEDRWAVTRARAGVGVGGGGPAIG